MAAALLRAQQEFTKCVLAVPFFDGNETGPSSLAEFLDKAENTWLGCGLGLEEPVGCRTLSVRLQGPANSWWLQRTVANDRPATFAQFRDGLRAAFLAPDHANVKYMALCSLAPPLSASPEHVAEYCSQWQQRRAALSGFVTSDTVELLLLSMFTLAMPAGVLQQELRAHPPATVAIAIPIVKALAASAAAAAHGKAQAGQGKAAGLHATAASAGKGRSERGSAVNKATLKCYNCDKLGHFARECPLKSAIKPEEDYSGARPVSPRVLLSAMGMVGGTRARILFDNGGTDIFISAAFAGRAHLDTSAIKSTSVFIERAGGEDTLDTNAKVIPLATVRVGGFSCNVTNCIILADIGDKYDVILGKPWWRQMGPRLKVDYDTNRMSVGNASWIAAGWGKPTVVAGQASGQASVTATIGTVDGAGLGKAHSGQGRAAGEPASPAQQTVGGAGAGQSQTSTANADSAGGAQNAEGEEDVYSLQQCEIFLITARQGARAVRKPGMAEAGYVFPRLVDDTPAASFDIGSGYASVGKPGVAQGKAGVMNRGLRFGNDGKEEPSAALQELLERYEQVMPVELPLKLPPTRGEPMHIETPVGVVPPSRPPIRLSEPEYAELRKQLRSLIKHGFIRPSTSPYAAPVFFVRKPGDTKLRLVADWRGLNSITVKNKLALPNLEELFDQLRTARRFTKLDLHSGFNQVRIADEDVHKTGITTRYGHFEFTVMHFGLTNGPATFQSLMNRVLQPFLGRFVVVFIDDVLIFSTTEEEHLAHVAQVLQALQHAELYCKPTKCVFGASIITFLGHVFTEGTMAVDPTKTSTVASWPTPLNQADVRRFVGLTNFFRKFVPRFSGLAAPLNNLLGSSKRWQWGEVEQRSFEAIKSALVSPPTLQLPDWSKPFVVEADASQKEGTPGTIAAVLLQSGRPVAYLSSKLTAAEMGYTIEELETLAAVRAVCSWRHYLFAKFVLHTDSQVVANLFTKRGQLTRRQQRWVEILNDFNFDVQRIKGKSNVADPLTHRPDGEEDAVASRPHGAGGVGVIGEELEPLDVVLENPLPRHGAVGKKSTTTTVTVDNNTVVLPVLGKQDGEVLASALHVNEVQAAVEGDAQAVAIATTWEPQLLMAIKAGYAEDPACMSIINRLRDKGASELRKSKLEVGAPTYTFEGDLLRVIQGDGAPLRIYIPQAGSLRVRVLSALHDAPMAGHPGRDRMLAIAQAAVYWPRLAKQIRDFVKSCDLCQRSKSMNRQTAAAVQPLAIPLQRWAHQTMDFLTGLPDSDGSDAICTVVDRATRRVHFLPTTKTVTAEGAAQLYTDGIVRLHGLPLSIVSDRDKLFTSLFWKELASILHVELHPSTANHPESDGLSERMHRTLVEMLRTMVAHHQGDWKRHLAMAEFAVNNLANASTGVSAFFADLGIHPIAHGLAAAQVMAAEQGRGQVAIGERAAREFAVQQRNTYQLVMDSMLEAQERLHRQDDKAGTRKAGAIGKGDMVMVSSAALLSPAQRDRPAQKLSFKWQGPFLVLEKLSPAAFRLQLGDIRAHPVINVKFLKPYFDPAGMPDRVAAPPDLVIGVGGRPEGVVEEVLSHQRSRHRVPRWTFTVKWEGLGVGGNSVEALDAFVDVDEDTGDTTINEAFLLYARNHEDVWAELLRRGWVGD